jgi:hypothetical protein
MQRVEAWRAETNVRREGVGCPGFTRNMASRHFRLAGLRPPVLRVANGCTRNMASRHFRLAGLRPLVLRVASCDAVSR